VSAEQTGCATGGGEAGDVICGEQTADFGNLYVQDITGAPVEQFLRILGAAERFIRDDGDPEGVADRLHTFKVSLCDRLFDGGDFESL